MRLLIWWLIYLLRQKSPSSNSLFIPLFDFKRALLIRKIKLLYILSYKRSNCFSLFRRNYSDFLWFGYLWSINNRNFIYYLVCAENFFLRNLDTIRTNNVWIFISLNDLTSCFIKLYFFKNNRRWNNFKNIWTKLFLLKSLWRGICS
jgi:hypothetical protein